MIGVQRIQILRVGDQWIGYASGDKLQSLEEDIRLGLTQTFASFTSILPWLAKMLGPHGNEVDDLNELIPGDYTALRCKRCDAIFLSKGYHSLYCSKRCKHAEEKKRQRARRAGATKETPS